MAKIQDLTVDIKVDTTELEKGLKEAKLLFIEFNDYMKREGINKRSRIDIMKALFSFKLRRNDGLL